MPLSQALELTVRLGIALTPSRLARALAEEDRVTSALGVVPIEVVEVALE